MSDYQDRIAAIEMTTPSRIPVSVGILPSAWMKYRDELTAVVKKHPDLFPSVDDARDYDSVWSETYTVGDHVDRWGCVWSNVKQGMEAFVTGHPVKTREEILTLEIPEADGNMKHGFMWLRLSDLRGFDEIMFDFAEEPEELQILIDKVLEYNKKQIEVRMKSLKGEKEIVTFGDDLGWQTGLPIHPEKWRKYLKPCFTEIYGPVKEAGHYVYMHTDGHIYEIIPDLKDAGVDVVNPQVGANGLDNLKRVCQGKICVDLDLDRQHFPFWKPGDIDAHVEEAVDMLGMKEGGLWLKAEIADDVPLENVDAILTALEKHRERYSD